MNLTKHNSFKGYENRLTLVLSLNIYLLFLNGFLVQNDI